MGGLAPDGVFAPYSPSAELIAAVLEMKRRNPRFGYQRIADQVNLAFDVPVDKHLVRRVLAKHCGPDPGSDGPSWLTFLGNSKDSLWSVDLFRCESLILRDASGDGFHGPVYASNCRICRALRLAGWSDGLPDVSSHYSRLGSANLLEF